MRDRTDLSFLGGFKLTFEHLTRPRVTRQYPDEKKPKQPRQHGRHVLNRYEDGMEKCIGCELCAGVCPADCIYVRGPRQPARPPGLAGRALRLRLRDQLPALHPLRPVRRGLPDRGHHRVEALRVLLHQPRRRHLHQARAAGRRRRPTPAPALGGLARGRRPAHLGLDAGHLAVGRRRLRGRGAVVRRARLRRAGARGRPERQPRRRGHRDQGPARRAGGPPARRGHPLRAPGHARARLAGPALRRPRQGQDAGAPAAPTAQAARARAPTGRRPDAGPRWPPRTRPSPTSSPSSSRGDRSSAVPSGSIIVAQPGPRRPLAGRDALRRGRRSSSSSRPTSWRRSRSSSTPARSSSCSCSSSCSSASTGTRTSTPSRCRASARWPSCSWSSRSGGVDRARRQRALGDRRPLGGRLDGRPAGHSNVDQLGQSVFTTYLFAFEATAGLLVIAVVGRGGAGPPAAPIVADDRAPTDAGRRRAPSAVADAERRRERGGGADEHRRRPGTSVLAARPVRHRRHRPAGPAQRAGHVHVHRADAQRRQPHLRHLLADAATTSAARWSVFFVLVVAAAEVVVGLGIVVAIFRRRASATADDLHILKG